jgi:hypothetical protein
MADRLTQLRQPRWWLQVLGIWALTRVVATVGFVWVASQQGPTPWSAAGHPSYFDFLDTWDAEWYRRIFQNGLGHDPGYPTHLPVNANGLVQQNSWAFMPGFPLLVRLLTVLTGSTIEWKFLAPTVSLVLSFVLAIVIYKVFRLKLDQATSLWGVTLFGLWCSSPVLQTSYAESLGLLLLASALYFLMQHRYLAAFPFLAALSITRPGMVSFALMLAAVWCVRFVQDRRSQVAFPQRERLALAALTASSAILGFAWPIFAWVCTGRADAYTKTELAWRSADPNAQLVLFEGWASLGSRWLGPLWAPLFVITCMAVAAWLLFTPSMRRLGYELRLWCASYLFYIFAVFYAQSSTWRILMMAFPLIGGFAFFSRNWTRFAKVVLILGLVAAQLYWLYVCWLFASPDFTPP